MTVRQNRIKLMDTGKSVTDLAKELQKKFGGNVASLRTMVDNMINCRNYYPKYAMYLNTEYGFQFDRPAHMRSVRELMKQAA